MSPATETLTPTVQLPSDQDASGRSFGAEEIDALAEVIRRGTLVSTKGNCVAELERHFAARVGAEHAVACSSGTAAVHIAIAAIDPEPGDEIVTTPITDMGALAPIVYQGAIPVFADVDPRTLNVTASTIEERLSSKTRAVVVTHLFGNPCEMEEIMRLADRHGLPVIEDSAQAFLATSGGRQVGTIGAIGCFSFQQGKHMTTGEGGVVVTDDEKLARRMRLFVNKAWGYGDPKPDHYFLALNYRLTELQGAVGLTQLEKLNRGVEVRRELAARLTERLAGLRGISTPWVGPVNEHTFWRYCLWVDRDVVPDGPDAIAQQLRGNGIYAGPRYIQKPAFQCEVFRDKRTFGQSQYPFSLARPEAIDYSPENYPGTFEGLSNVLVLPWNERFTAEHVDFIADSVEEAVRVAGKG